MREIQETLIMIQKILLNSFQLNKNNEDNETS